MEVILRAMDLIVKIINQIMERIMMGTRINKIKMAMVKTSKIMGSMRTEMEKKTEEVKKAMAKMEAIIIRIMVTLKMEIARAIKTKPKTMKMVIMVTIKVITMKMETHKAITKTITNRTIMGTHSNKPTIPRKDKEARKSEKN
jgi:hypothetical protein